MFWPVLKPFFGLVSLVQGRLDWEGLVRFVVLTQGMLRVVISWVRSCYKVGLG